MNAKFLIQGQKAHRFERTVQSVQEARGIAKKWIRAQVFAWTWGCVLVDGKRIEISIRDGRWVVEESVC